MWVSVFPVTSILTSALLGDHLAQAYLYNNANLSQNISGPVDSQASFYNNGSVTGNKVGGVEARNGHVVFI